MTVSDSATLNDNPDGKGQTHKPLLAVLNGEKQPVPPIWLMRQAGRYLPEYRTLRADKGGFLAMVYDPATAAEITMQPLRRFGFDGSILFSDILIVPHALGQDLWFEVGEGPRLAPPLLESGIEVLSPAAHHFDPVYETVRQVRGAIEPRTTFLGFAGSPWTVATYMVAGKGSRDQEAARRLAYLDPERFSGIIQAITDSSITYLSGQIDAGVDAIQLFDSWSGPLSPALFERWVIAPNAAIVSALKARYPHLRIIGFPKGAGGRLAAYARETGVDAVGLDETVDPMWANAQLPVGFPVQGNLDPLALIAGGEALESAVRHILAAFAERPHIFNLGHGILPDTPIAHVECLLALVREG